MEDKLYPIEFENDSSSFVVYNHGTAPAPCVLTFIPKVDYLQLIIEGLSAKPITVNQVMKNNVLVIDGEQHLVTIDGENAIDNYDDWEFPKLQPGENRIVIPNGALAAISIEYNPRYI